MLKSSVVAIALGVAALGSFSAVMIWTNPTLTDYQVYAVEELTQYSKERLCAEAKTNWKPLGQQKCATIVDQVRPQLSQLIAKSTRQQNFVFFSLYQTELSVGPLLPSYRFETVAAFQDFYTYLNDERVHTLE
ncbi:hypothetical protein DO97_12325 [Neosynechococcus sphagnicola sy1]|uniref:DUF4359 domain-containing protein n=1 Tax=Neosynechococcus sphagnicola sy1 TaxID=1497020 RepID=A0A098THT2_9CYAN|nr:DUF4359 domain-containing protein [Neosynechococcus sphagnicola]KGF72120.1 hypothetical protein DO97_12325 [Neosynechococcus sphagnicola sy1]